MIKENQTSPENLQQSAVKLELPADLLTQLEQVKVQAEALSGGNPNWLEEQMKNLKGYDTYGREMSEFSGELDALEKSGLEPFNFRVDSTGWKLEEVDSENGKIQVKVNPEGNIWEYVSGVSPELIGEQLFTWESAMRETEKYGKKVPLKEDWEKICELYGDDGMKLSKDLGLPFAGYRVWSTGNYIYQSVLASYWSSSLNSANAYFLDFDASNINPANVKFRAYAFSLRCIKN